MFGYWRWQKLENIIIESTNSQEQYRIIHAALKSTIQLDHLGEQVSEWSPTDSVDYQQKLVETNNSLDGLRKYYSKSQIDSMQNILNQKGHLLSEIYATIVGRSPYRPSTNWPFLTKNYIPSVSAFSATASPKSTVGWTSTSAKCLMRRTPKQNANRKN